MKIAKSTVIFLGVILPFVLSAQEPQKPGKLQWTKLGTTAQINNDFFTHVFRIRKNARVFSKLELRINGIFVLDWVLVGYEDGATWSPTEYPAIAIRKTYTFSLPDNGKMVKSVEIRYHDVGGPINTAAVDLWGGRPKVPMS
ncbi:MAG: hypothetical protein A2W03_02390 [Candidatus Aminicenantes bacterium RBG_16_63_16]|nr:MAG: hypothetical protein A2W03_02390 [Candidatus Aminicenantes bacterium RBG_16_63_16]